MQYLSYSIRWDYYRHILTLVLTDDKIRYVNLRINVQEEVWKKCICERIR